MARYWLVADELLAYKKRSVQFVWLGLDGIPMWLVGVSFSLFWDVFNVSPIVHTGINAS